MYVCRADLAFVVLKQIETNVSRIHQRWDGKSSTQPTRDTPGHWTRRLEGINLFVTCAVASLRTELMGVFIFSFGYQIGCIATKISQFLLRCMVAWRKIAPCKHAFTALNWVVCTTVYKSCKGGFTRCNFYCSNTLLQPAQPSGFETNLLKPFERIKYMQPLQMQQKTWFE